VLPISHDEVVHGKKSLLDRMPGEYEKKFAGTRAFMAYMMTHPGKKLMFMGSEIGMFREWDYEDQIEWFLLDYDMHARLQLFNAEINRFYLSQPAMWERDDDRESFCWIDADNADQSIYSYRRIDRKGRELIVLINFLPVTRENFLLAVPNAGIYEEIFNTDDTRYGGEGNLNRGRYKTVPCMLRGYTNAIPITVPAMSAVIFRCVRRAPAKKKTDKIK
jgi:1,4-alpha-glucan branching enzyme